MTSEYEQLRLKNIADNQRILAELGLLNPYKPLPKVIKKKVQVAGKRKREDSPVRREKKYIVNISGENDENIEKLGSQFEYGTRRRSSRVMGLEAPKQKDIEEEIEKSNEEKHAEEKERRQSLLNRPKVYGVIPGVPVGKWWATRMECNHDGIHRPTVAGIHGGPEGAYSIALSGGYEDDIDLGECFTYTGEGGRDLKGTANNPKNLRTAPQSKDQCMSKGNAALVKSSETGMPVRVIRGYKLQIHSTFAPEEGYRYDGLYKVEKQWYTTGMAGFGVFKFMLRRIKDQAPPPWTLIGSNNTMQEYENNNCKLTDLNPDITFEVKDTADGKEEPEEDAKKEDSRKDDGEETMEEETMDVQENEGVKKELDAAEEEMRRKKDNGKEGEESERKAEDCEVNGDKSDGGEDKESKEAPEKPEEEVKQESEAEKEDEQEQGTEKEDVKKEEIVEEKKDETSEKEEQLDSTEVKVETETIVDESVSEMTKKEEEKVESVDESESEKKPETAEDDEAKKARMEKLEEEGKKLGFMTAKELEAKQETEEATDDADEAEKMDAQPEETKDKEPAENDNKKVEEASKNYEGNADDEAKKMDAQPLEANDDEGKDDSQDKEPADNDDKENAASEANKVEADVQEKSDKDSNSKKETPKAGNKRKSGRKSSLGGGDSAKKRKSSCQVKGADEVFTEIKSPNDGKKQTSISSFFSPPKK